MRRWVLTVAVLACLIPGCRAQDTLLWDELNLDELARSGQEYSAGIELSPSVTLDEGLGAVAEQAEEHLPGILRNSLGSALLLMAVVLLCAMAEGAQTAGNGEGGRVVAIAGALAITAACAGNVDTMMGLGRATIQRIQDFSQVLLPAMAAVTAATGGAAGAAARQIATAVFSNLMLTVIDELLVPLVYAYVTACTAYAAVGNPGLKKTAAALKWVVTTSLSILLMVFVTYLTVSGVIAGNTDAVALKATKMTINTAVPVVGRIISDAAETMLVGAGMLKNAVGLFGMITVLCICVAPFLQLGVHYLSYKLSSALASTLADSRLAELIENISTAFGLILGMTGACAMLLLVSMVSGMAGGGA